MNTSMKFYSATVAFLLRKKLSARAALKDIQVFCDAYVNELDQLCVLATNAEVDWKKSDLDLLWTCVNDPTTVESDDTWLNTKEGFVVSAFKDLSVIKNPEAMKLFAEIRNLMLGENTTDAVVWTRTVKARPDGSVVYIIHASSQKMFEKHFGDFQIGQVIHD